MRKKKMYRSGLGCRIPRGLNTLEDLLFIM